MTDAETISRARLQLIHASQAFKKAAKNLAAVSSRYARTGAAQHDKLVQELEQARLDRDLAREHYFRLRAEAEKETP